MMHYVFLFNYAWSFDGCGTTFRTLFKLFSCFEKYALFRFGGFLTPLYSVFTLGYMFWHKHIKVISICLYIIPGPVVRLHLWRIALSWSKHYLSLIQCHWQASQDILNERLYREMYCRFSENRIALSVRLVSKFGSKLGLDKCLVGVGYMLNIPGPRKITIIEQ